MKKKIISIVLCFCLAMVLIPQQSHAQITEIISIIKGAIKKVVQALDLEVQKLQNKTIWLQNAQKTLENAMTELKLNDITDWVQKQKDLYAEYYQELWQVKQIISDYDKVKQIIQRQEQIVIEYKQAYALFQKDKNFSSQEISYMYNVFSGILDQSLKNVDQVLLVVNAFVTQMSDAQRINIIDNAAKGMEKIYNDLKQFNNQNIQLSLQRSAEKGDVETVKKLYGL